MITETSNKLISIICVTYNAVNHLENCLKSIFDQKYPYIEVVIMDGNSTDGTQQILKRWNTKIAYWKSEPDNGIYDAMNKALEYVTGDWVYFIGSDDELLPEFSDFVEKELENPYTVYYSSILYKGKKEGRELNAYQHLKNGILHQATIYPISVFKKYKYDLKYKISADTALNILIYGDKQFKMTYRNYIIAKFNDGGISSAYKDKKLRKDKPKLAFKHFGLKIYLRYQLRVFKKLFKKDNLIEV